MSDVAVLGGGAWGTALAAMLARKGERPFLWARDAETVRTIGEGRRNPRYLGDIALPDGIRATGTFADVGAASIILVVTPTQSLRGLIDDLKPHLDRVGSPPATLVLCAKGIERDTGLRVSEIVAARLPDHPIAVLSGPSFAHDVARGLPTAVTLAAPRLDDATALSERLSSPTFRLYASDDIAGVELGGALKNVIALAVGMARARGLGASAEAALTTRGFAELSRIAGHFGAKSETLTGLSCLGDLMLTCSSPQSRNFAYGMAVGRGEPLHGLKLAEGVHTVSIAADICRKASIEVPIIDAIDAVLTGKLNLDQAMAALLARPLKTEIS